MRFHDVFPMAKMLHPPDTEYRCSQYSLAAVPAAMVDRIASGFALHREPTREGIVLVVRLPERRLEAYALAPDGTEYAARGGDENDEWQPSAALRWARAELAKTTAR